MASSAVIDLPKVLARKLVLFYQAYQQSSFLSCRNELEHAAEPEQFALKAAAVRHHCLIAALASEPPRLSSFWG